MMYTRRMHNSLRALPVIALSALIVVACDATPAPGTGTGANVNVEAEGKMTMSIKDLLKLGKNYTCTFAEVDENGIRTDGTMYVQGETNFRADFTMTEQNGTKTDMHMLMANDTSYMWSADEPQGMMMRLDPEDDSLFGNSEESDDTVVEDDEPLELDCRKWSPSRSMFTPPADREFIDFQAQLDAMMRQNAGSQCELCDQMPNETEQAECRKAMNC